MLEPDQDKRPNIFQVCHIVHHLRGFNNPVANVFVSVHVDVFIVWVVIYVTHKSKILLR